MLVMTVVLYLGWQSITRQFSLVFQQG